MSLILPKGIVVNTPELNQCIERINTDPLDLADIARFWKVYTTTKRRLLDPTAERLENYWWRIWGSKKRTLNGATVARLFAYISDGQSFVPLRGPPNRDEGPPLDNNARRGPGGSSTTAIHRPNQSRSSTTSSSNTSRPPATMPHPILKKTRGPSTTGPRPTARFISPHDTEDDIEDSSITNSHVVIQPPSPTSPDTKSDRKLNIAATKKKTGFIASTAAKKKRPMIVRRQSSQSSNENASKGGNGQAADAVQPSCERTTPVYSEHGERLSREWSQSNTQEVVVAPNLTKKRSRTSDRPSTLPSKPTTEQPDQRPSSLETLAFKTDPLTETGPSNNLRKSENQQGPITADSLAAEELDALEEQRLLLAESNARLENTQVQPVSSRKGFARKPTRSKPVVTRNLDMKSSRILPREEKSVASAVPTLVDATGQVDSGRTSQNVKTLGGSSSTKRGKGKGKGRESEELPSGQIICYSAE